MADGGRGVGAGARPVVAALARRGTVQIRPGQDVVLVRLVAATVHDRAFFGQRVVLRQLVVVAVQIGDVGGYLHALGDEPGTGPDAIFRMHLVGAEIGAPLPVADAGGLRQGRAVCVGARDPAEVAALAGVGAGDEKAQAVPLRVNV